jgi:hypothetical protein
MARELFKDSGISTLVPDGYKVWYDYLPDCYAVLELESMRLAWLSAEELFNFIESRTIKYGQQNEPPPLVEGNGRSDAEPTG